MDGRVQLPVIHFLQKRFQAEYVDLITEPGPNRILAEGRDSERVESIFARLRISVEKHESVGVAVVGHHDCAGNPVPKEEQVEQVRRAVRTIRQRYDGLTVIGLWIDERWVVHELEADAAAG